MKIKIVGIILCILAFSKGFGQQIFTATNYQPEDEFENTWSKDIYSDSLATSTLLWIKGKIKPHKHEFHTEHVYILEGSGDMSVGGETMSIIKGDIVIIPMNTPHSLEVTSMDPLKVISIKSPEYFGKDRIIVE